MAGVEQRSSWAFGTGALVVICAGLGASRLSVLAGRRLGAVGLAAAVGSTLYAPTERRRKMTAILLMGATIIGVGNLMRGISKVAGALHQSYSLDRFYHLGLVGLNGAHFFPFLAFTSKFSADLYNGRQYATAADEAVGQMLRNGWDRGQFLRRLGTVGRTLVQRRGLDLNDRHDNHVFAADDHWRLAIEQHLAERVLEDAQVVALISETVGQGRFTLEQWKGWLTPYDRTALLAQAVERITPEVLEESDAFARFGASRQEMDSLAVHLGVLEEQAETACQQHEWLSRAEVWNREPLGDEPWVAGLGQIHARVKGWEEQLGRLEELEPTRLFMRETVAEVIDDIQSRLLSVRLVNPWLEARLAEAYRSVEGFNGALGDFQTGRRQADGRALVARVRGWIEALNPQPVVEESRWMSKHCSKGDVRQNRQLLEALGTSVDQTRQLRAWLLGLAREVRGVQVYLNAEEALADDAAGQLVTLRQRVDERTPWTTWGEPLIKEPIRGEKLGNWAERIAQKLSAGEEPTGGEDDGLRAIGHLMQLKIDYTELWKALGFGSDEEVDIEPMGTRLVQIGLGTPELMEKAGIDETNALEEIGGRVPALEPGRLEEEVVDEEPEVVAAAPVRFPVRPKVEPSWLEERVVGASLRAFGGLRVAMLGLLVLRGLGKHHNWIWFGLAAGAIDMVDGRFKPADYRQRLIADVALRRMGRLDRQERLRGQAPYRSLKFLYGGERVCLLAAAVFMSNKFLGQFLQLTFFQLGSLLPGVGRVSFFLSGWVVARAARRAMLKGSASRVERAWNGQEVNQTELERGAFRHVENALR